MNPLPPQAYTRDTLQKAYSWLSTQEPSIRAMASTADILVSLYLKATRDGDSVLQRPSIQNFKNELKHLAPMVEEFERTGERNIASENQSSTETTTAEAAAEVGAFPDFVTNSTPSSTLLHPQSPNGASHSSMPTANSAPHPTQTMSTTFGASPTVSQGNHLRLTPKILAADLDEKSLFWIKEVREKFNLSNDQEALRLLVRIGYSKVSGLLKD